MNNMQAEILEQIRKWHEDERRSTLKRTFELGDLIVRAVIHTGLSENEVIRTIMSDLGELALGQTSYNRAARISRVFTDNQREVLIDAMVCLEKCEMLASNAYDDRARTQMIYSIKIGKIKSPWNSIRGYRAIKRSISREIERSDSTANQNVMTIELYKRGQLNDDAVVDGLKHIISRAGRPKFQELCEVAMRETKMRRVI